MISLLLATFFSASFGLIVRHSLGQGRNLWAIGAINYATAMLFHLTHSLVRHEKSPIPTTIIIGILGGISFVSAFFMFFPLIKMRGVSVATAATRLAVVIPILAAILLWGEQPNHWQMTGSLLALISLPLLTIKPVEGGGQALPPKARLLLVGQFTLNGFCLLATRGFSQTGVQGQNSIFLAILFGTAAFIAHIVWWFHRRESSWRDAPLGVALGLCNALSNLMLLAALQELPSVLVFPFQSAIGLVYVAVFARLVWGERIQRLEMAGMAVALVAVVLINAG